MKYFLVIFVMAFSIFMVHTDQVIASTDINDFWDEPDEAKLILAIQRGDDETVRRNICIFTKISDQVITLSKQSTPEIAGLVQHVIDFLEKERKHPVLSIAKVQSEQ